MKIILCDVAQYIVSAWQHVMRDTTLDVEIIHADITQLTVGAVVSPANSFGFMDGGVDLRYSQFFGWHIQQRLQDRIKCVPFEELLVGQALSISTDNTQIPWVISAPTMRVPGRITDFTAIYLATRAAMAEADTLNIDSVAFPGMGTGTGGVPVRMAAQLMMKGILGAREKEPFPVSLQQLMRRTESFLI